MGVENLGVKCESESNNNVPRYNASLESMIFQEYLSFTKMIFLMFNYNQYRLQNKATNEITK